MPGLGRRARVLQRLIPDNIEGTSPTTAMVWPRARLGAILCVMALLALHGLQRHLMFMHKIAVPWSANLSEPSACTGLHGHNLALSANGSVVLRGWHLHADDRADVALAGAQRVVLYLHGNLGTRAVEHRVRLYRLLARTFGFDVVVFDYRGMCVCLGGACISGHIHALHMDCIQGSGIAQGGILARLLSLKTRSLSTGGC